MCIRRSASPMDRRRAQRERLLVQCGLHTSSTFPNTTCRPSSHEVFTVCSLNKVDNDYVSTKRKTICKYKAAFQDKHNSGTIKHEHTHRNKELAAVRPWPRIGHAEIKGCLVLELEVLVLKLGAVYGLATATVEIREIPALDHELGNDAV